MMDYRWSQWRLVGERCFSDKISKDLIIQIAMDKQGYLVVLWIPHLLFFLLLRLLLLYESPSVRDQKEGFVGAGG